VSRKHWLWIVGLGVVALIGLGAFALQGPLAYARVATAYAAQQTCACLYVSGRAMASCLADFPEDAVSQMTIVTAEGGVSAHAVKVSALAGLIKAEATYDAGFGCSLVD
jgi:hypothetical protein